LRTSRLPDCCGISAPWARPAGFAELVRRDKAEPADWRSCGISFYNQLEHTNVSTELTLLIALNDWMFSAVVAGCLGTTGASLVESTSILGLNPEFYGFGCFRNGVFWPTLLNWRVGRMLNLFRAFVNMGSGGMLS
jgi:hypothetical protein